MKHTDGWIETFWCCTACKAWGRLTPAQQHQADRDASRLWSLRWLDDTVNNLLLKVTAKYVCVYVAVQYVGILKWSQSCLHPTGFWRWKCWMCARMSVHLNLTKTNPNTLAWSEQTWPCRAKYGFNWPAVEFQFSSYRDKQQGRKTNNNSNVLIMHHNTRGV